MSFSLVGECSLPVRSMPRSSTFSRVNMSVVGWRSGGGDRVILERSARSSAEGVPAGESLVGEIDLARSVLPYVNDTTKEPFVFPFKETLLECTHQLFELAALFCLVRSLPPAFCYVPHPPDRVSCRALGCASRSR
jgi:hypothetical protein